ncbi:TetR family transcriptional regulator [Caballeronia cordobensis]|uniref:TetR family transcriptional regulator n=2 Tax=Caballeronia cordobensis TaxID=1353886 RepID=A0A158I9K4_CABCO|nr:TetR family transcriptional regulator [Caballeronia cordobensis]
MATRTTKTTAKSKPRAPAKSAARPYHHGSLREAMLEAAERILARDGIDGLTLRAAAREAGASHAAPKNHFENVAGLLSELAAVGFRRFERCLTSAAADADTPETRLAAIGRAYVEFAIRFPGLFLLMFRSERLDIDRPNLREAMSAASSVVRVAVGAQPGPHDTLSADGAARLVTAWSLVHGFAMLKIDGRLDPIVASLSGGLDAMALLDVILKSGGGRLMNEPVAKKKTR